MGNAIQALRDVRDDDKKGRWWICLIYPGDSCPDDYLTFIDGLHVPALLSPIHHPDPESSDEDEHKKFHRHLMTYFDGKKTDEQVNSILSYLNGTKAFKAISPSGYARYLTHLDHPHKEQFPLGSVLQFAGTNYDEICKGDDSSEVDAICDLIEDLNIFAFSDLKQVVRVLNPEWNKLVFKRYSIFFKTYLAGRWMKYTNNIKNENVDLILKEYKDNEG